MTALEGILAALLAASLCANGFLFGYARSIDRSYRGALTNLMDRVSTTPRIEIREVPVASPEPSKNPRYIPDTPYADEAWNEFRGDVDEDDV